MAAEALQKLGWHLTSDGIEECTENGKSNADDIVRVAIDLDLKNIGKKCLPEGINKMKEQNIEGPYVVQIMKVRNVTAPKENEESYFAPPMLRISITDGHTTCNALDMDKLPRLGLNTPPGTKLQLQGKIPVNLGFLLLTRSNARVLGGHVDKLVDNWELKRTLAKHTRSLEAGGGGGPPTFVPFGQRSRDMSHGYSRRDNFKSLENKDKDKNNEDSAFEEQRQASIQEALQAKDGGHKVFGGKLAPNDKDVAKIVEMGFSSDQATTALRQSEGNVQGAIHSLLSNGTETGPPPPAASHPYPHGGGGAGPAGRGGDSGRGRGVGRGAGHDNREHRPGTVDRGDKPDKGSKV